MERGGLRPGLPQYLGQIAATAVTRQREIPVNVIRQTLCLSTP